jgi:hypothetical protein
VDGCSAHQGVNVNPAYGASQKVRAWFELCKDPSPPSVEHDTQNPPAPLLPCGFEPYVSGGHQITVNGVVNGAKVTLYRNGAPVGPTSHWTGAAIIVQCSRTKTCIVTRSRTSIRPMPSSLAG